MKRRTAAILILSCVDLFFCIGIILCNLSGLTPTENALITFGCSALALVSGVVFCLAFERMCDENEDADES